MVKKKAIELNAEQLMEAYRNEQSRFAFLQRRQLELQRAIQEIMAAIDTINELKKGKSEENILVSLGAGTYIEAKVANVKKVKTGLAGNILIEETLEKTEKKLLEERKKVEKSLIELREGMRKVAENVKGFEKVFRQIRERMAKQRAEPKPSQGHENISVS